MALKIYNSITKKKEEFKPLHEGFVGMYVCGPTVYGPTHVGHARSYVDFDVVFRYLSFLGYKVKYVQNITDVGHLVGDSDDGQDKILRQAKIEKIDPYEIAYKYENQYFDTMAKLNVLKPSISVRATGCILEMIDMVQTIIDKGYGYVTSKGNVYFDVHKFKKYGALSNRTLTDTKSGERIAVAEDKKNPEDFALWKCAEPGHLMKWKSPWSVGFPGWHLECSTMSKKFLGDTFDIHGGGIDNIFPHHESEIAQSEVANGKPFVRFFMHNNLVTVNGTKMGKSLGNFITLEDLFAKFDPIKVRFFILQFHYRSPIDFNFNAIENAGAVYDRINDAVISLRETCKDIAEITDPEIKEIYNNFVNAMNEDFNTPVAISELIRAVKVININVQAKNTDKLKQLNKLIADLAENVLGLKFESNKNQSSNKEQELLDIIENTRQILREEKNYALSDKIRDELQKSGFVAQDKKLK